MQELLAVFLMSMLSCGLGSDPNHVLLHSTANPNSASYVNLIWGDPRQWVAEIWREETMPDFRSILSNSPSVSFHTMAVHHAGRRMYWHNLAGNNMMSTNLVYNGTHTTQTFSAPCSDKVYGVAFDWVSENLYWTDSVYNWIVMAPISNIRIFKIVLDTGLQSPHGIVVDPASSRIFWADSGTKTIEQSDLSGAARRVVYQDGIARPTVLTQDGNWLYWKDTTASRLMKMTLDGGNGQVVLSGSTVATFVGLDVYNGLIFACNNPDGLYIYNGTNSKRISIPGALESFDVLMFAPEKQQELASPCASAGCEHLCVGRDNNSRADCLCHHLYEELDESDCILPAEAIIPSPTYFITNGTNVLRILAWAPDVDNVGTSSMLKTESTAIAATYSDHMLYVAGTGGIKRVQLTLGSSLQTIVYGLLDDPRGLAVDWWSGNLYWTDATHQHIMTSTSDGRYSLILRPNLTGTPYGIVVNSKYRRLFWAEINYGVSSSGAIWQSFTDGSGAAILVDSNVRTPKYLAIDHAEERLYWTDEERQVIESVTFSGAARQTLPVTARPLGLSIFQDYLAWTSNEVGKAGIYWNRKGNAVATRFIRTTGADDITLYWNSHHPNGTGPCSDSSRCDQLCLPSYVGKVCVCAVGFKLNTDGVSCDPNFPPLQDNYLILTDSFRKEMYQMDATSGRVRAIPVDVSHENPVALDIHPGQGKLYWSDVQENQIWSAKLDGTELDLIRTLPGSIVDGLAIDYINNLIYYTETFLDRIYVMDTSGQNKVELIGDHLQGPRAIVVDIKNRVMYWTDVADDPASNYVAKIERASAVDGSGRTVLVSSELKWPNALTIDFRAQKMFWADAFLDKLEEANLDGSDRRTLRYDPTAHYYGITHDDNFLYITDWHKRGVYKYERTSGQMTQLGPFKFERLNAVKVYTSSQTLTPSPTTKTTTTTTITTTTTAATSTSTTTTTESPTTTASTTTISAPTRTATPNSTPVQTTPSTTRTAEKTASPILNVTTIIGIAVGVGGAIIITSIILITVVCCRRRTNKPGRNPPQIYSTPMTDVNGGYYDDAARGSSGVYDDIPDESVKDDNWGYSILADIKRDTNPYANMGRPFGHS